MYPNPAVLADGVPLPESISFVTPLEIRIALCQAYHTEKHARTQLSMLEENTRNRFYRLCPIENTAVFQEHCSSVDRILDWTGGNMQSMHQVSSTLAPALKVPSFVLKFTVDEQAYSRYLNECNEMYRMFFNSTLVVWKQCKRRGDEVLRHSQISKLNKLMCLRWWNKFLEDALAWESRIEDLTVSSWPDIIAELSTLIEERVDFEEA
ncbi:hypothetical protein LOZ39_001912 [Ophidiomyces ophidiicola]|nr:hypothetical protein LOZ49_000823 [Ophidiomyces ophidiicola]KAI2057819.1 hypothetical protein LOZ44_001302 [Ophidiomyces ophidiicola]KAI2077915.1 hypothetical protein LOZ39_001912 [Ophidiomyces ophidiicola]KAI2141443.1 hypothetical protein LOZ28_002518 [Ophidiomyces ophidiicola]KAI2146383.1 hypothetical protein LOZ29_000140 [Ophidiomyces ophidiicola]